MSKTGLSMLIAQLAAIMAAPLAKADDAPIEPEEANEEDKDDDTVDGGEGDGLAKGEQWVDATVLVTALQEELVTARKDRARIGRQLAKAHAHDDGMERLLKGMGNLLIALSEKVNEQEATISKMQKAMETTVLPTVNKTASGGASVDAVTRVLGGDGSNSVGGAGLTKQQLMKAMNADIVDMATINTFNRTGSFCDDPAENAAIIAKIRKA